MSTFREFKNSFWGYNKADVCTYIASMNEEFSRKIVEKDAEHAEEVNALKQRIEALEAENLELERNHRQISNTLLDANAFATELREKAVAEDARMREENAARNLAQTARIEQFGRKIDEIRDAIHSFLKTIDGELEKESETIDATLRENRMAERNVENAGGITEGEKKE